MVRNGQNNTNPAGSSHGEQLQPKRLTLLSASVVKSFPKLAKSESDQMVSEKVKLTYFDVYLSHTMWNHTKKSMKGLKQPTLVFLQWEVADWQELFAKNARNKGN